MIRKITAILLVFAVLAGFAACKRLEGNEFNVQENAFAVDDEGVTRELETRVNEEGETEYFYTDTNGNEIVVDKNKVSVETTYVPVQTTLSDKEIEEILESGDLGKLEDVVIEDIAEPEFEMSDGVISEETFEEVEVELDSEGKPVRGETIKTMEEILKSGTFTMDFTIKTSVDGTENTIPFKMIKDGNRMFMETVYPISDTGKMRVGILVNEEGYFITIPVMNAYIKAPADENGNTGNMEDIFAGYDFSDIEEDIEMKDNYVSSAKVTLNGKTYDCDVYEAEDGTVVKQYYLNNELKRIETTSESGDTIVEFKEISDKVDKSKLETPKGIDLSTKLEALESLMGSFSTTNQ